MSWKVSSLRGKVCSDGSVVSLLCVEDGSECHRLVLALCWDYATNAFVVPPLQVRQPPPPKRERHHCAKSSFGCTPECPRHSGVWAGACQVTNSVAMRFLPEHQCSPWTQRAAGWMCSTVEPPVGGLGTEP